MPDIDLVEELLIVLAVTIAIVYLFQKMRVPAIVGFLLAGVVIGPGGWGLITGVSQVETLADLGLVLLLFTIGIEFSLETILSMQRRILVAGLLQVLLTILAILGIASVLGVSPAVGVFFGFLVAMSSTAIVLRAYQERGEINSLHGRLASGTLLFQDLCIVPMMLMVPFLARSGPVDVLGILFALFKSLLAVGLIVWLARKVLPRLLRQVALVRNREIFVLFIVLVCVGTAWLSSKTGLSLALGALIAGLVISESELSHQVVADVLPLRDCFSGIFFISIGMLLDPGSLARDWLTPASELLVLVSVKTGVTLLVFWYLYRSLRLGILLGLSLAQIGEFSFILAKAGIGHRLLSATEEQTFLAASILSMIGTPLLIQAAHGITKRMTGKARRHAAVIKTAAGAPELGRIEGHVIIIGYGLNGQNLARVLRESGIPYQVLELDPELVSRGKMAGEPISFGDGTRTDILEQMQIGRARVLVIAISDPAATARVVSQARRIRQDINIIVRTRYVAEIERLYRLGANQVIPEEFETSVEIFARVLQEFHIPRNVIALQVDLIRKEHYGTLRGLRLQGRPLDELSQYLVGATTDIFSVPPDSPLVGKTLREIDFRERSRVTVIAAVRDGKPFHNVGPEFVLKASDRLVLLGDHKALDDAARRISPDTVSERLK
ncbi:MAG TPA: cation:proton antiporter [Candidatus Binatia bacterium]|jgi:K+:H+ antiporter|nr:cation:proton antiporter [Candidatus Binatia bacterium]